MQYLAGKDILVGREPDRRRLMILVDNKFTVLGAEGSVPNSVSKCVAVQQVAHCKISVGKDLSLTLLNLKEQNVTFVNDKEVLTKKISETDNLGLGREKYKISVSDIISAAEKIVAPKPSPVPSPAGGGGQAAVQRPGQPAFSILPLKYVWKEYDEAVLSLTLNEKKKANRHKLQGMLTMSAMLLALIPIQSDIISGIRYVLLVGALLFGVVSYIKGANLGNDIVVKRRKLDEKFRHDYTCPNPECKHFMGNQPYDILEQNTMCPYCRCKFKK